MSDSTPESFREVWQENEGDGKILIGSFLVGGILGAIANPASAGSAFFVVGIFFAGIAWTFATEEGKEFRKEFKKNMDDAQQTQQQNSSSAPSIVCSNCGWQNPEDNNYCHDCGEEIAS